MGDAQSTAGGPAWSGLGWDGAFQTLFFLQMFGAAPQGGGGVSTPRSVQEMSGCGLVGVLGSSQRSFPALLILWFCVLSLITPPVYVPLRGGPRCARAELGMGTFCAFPRANTQFLSGV